MDTLFQAGNLVAALGWLLLIAGCFVARLRPTALVICGVVLPAGFCLTYLALVAMLFANPPPAGMDMQSLAGVQAVFVPEIGALAGWYHYLAFDLFIGAWMVRDGLPRGISPWLLTPALILTFPAGPVGWLAYFGLRALRRRREPVAA